MQLSMEGIQIEGIIMVNTMTTMFLNSESISKLEKFSNTGHFHGNRSSFKVFHEFLFSSPSDCYYGLCLNILPLSRTLPTLYSKKEALLEIFQFLIPIYFSAYNIQMFFNLINLPLQNFRRLNDEIFNTLSK